MNQSVGTKDVFESLSDSMRVRKYSNYFDIYDRFLGAYRNRSPKLLEIGVQHGGSLEMWNRFFAGNVDIVGIDINPECERFAVKNVRIFIGDQSDENFLRSVVDQVGKFDIVVDDGSHIPSHQIKSFEHLFFEGLADDGVYICEDCFTSYWKRYGGGLRKRGTFIEYAKRLCDQVNAWHADLSALPVNQATKWIKCISFFSSVVVFERAEMPPPLSLEEGTQTIDLNSPFAKSRFSRLILALRRVA